MATAFKVGEYSFQFSDDNVLEVYKADKTGKFTIGARISFSSEGTFLHVALETGESITEKIASTSLGATTELCKLIISKLENYEKNTGS